MIDGPTIRSCAACQRDGLPPDERPYDTLAHCLNCGDLYCKDTCLTNGACDDPDCQAVAAQAAKYEAEIKADEDAWKRVFGLTSPLDAFSVEGSK